MLANADLFHTEKAEIDSDLKPQETAYFLVNYCHLLIFQSKTLSMSVFPITTP